MSAVGHADDNARALPPSGAAAAPRLWRIHGGCAAHLLVPLFWYVFFLAGPLLMVVVTSLMVRGTYGGIDWQPSFGNFIRAADPLYLRIFFRSFLLGWVTATICALIGVPTALAMVSRPPRQRARLLACVAIPFLSNLIIRLYAIKLFTAHSGPLAYVLTALGVVFDPFVLSSNTPLVIFGMTTTFLPFMLFPLYAALEKFDFSMLEAATDLGASSRQVLFQIILPILRKPLIAGFFMVFIPACGEFVIPDLLGGARTMLIGNLITEQFLKARDWPFGAALSVMLLFALGGSLLLSEAFLAKRGSR